MYIPRVKTQTTLSTFINSSMGSQKAVMQPFGGAESRLLKLNVPSPSLLKTLEFIDDPEAGRAPEPDEVEISVKAVDANYQDVMIAMGQ